MTWFLLFIGGGIGTLARHGVNLLVTRAFGAGFPWGILIINVTGSTLMGLVAGWFAKRGGGEASQQLRLFLATGVLGGYTTFSAFSLDVAALWERGEHGAMLAYMLGSVLLSVLGLFAGLWFWRSIS